ncbi:MAG: hypothetical protein SGARI_005038, partial [Bacillariaceae sp.]
MSSPDNDLVQKPPESTVSVAADLSEIPADPEEMMSWDDAVRAFEEEMDAFDKKMDELEPLARKLAQDVDEYIKDCDQRVAKLEAGVEEQKAAWECTERLVGEVLVTLAVATVAAAAPSSRPLQQKNSHR